ncbi:hypothetical protein T4D_8067 [Trichinella pseudospiralis]|uniref:Uncharacterized protein n=1 Tax=Trichinella pseudospiralis TaxID=6337 RepID=A0A0V1F6G8_TRIPS|nr:hypothetical protein T4D_8067 [Trichinella pseudospiralis]
MARVVVKKRNRNGKVSDGDRHCRLGLNKSFTRRCDDEMQERKLSVGGVRIRDECRYALE